MHRDRIQSIEEMAESLSGSLVSYGVHLPRFPLLAVSGGVDSMVLLHLFTSLKRDSRIDDFSVFTMDHCLREESSLELELVRNHCHSTGIGFYGFTRDVEKFSRRIGMGLEEGGRLLRYKIMRRLILTHRYDCAVTGHHADDYFETLLMHLIRGSGEAALHTQPLLSVRDGFQIFRPLTLFSRATVLEVARNENIIWMEDASNLHHDYLRNRVRHKIVPSIKEEGLNPVRLWSNFHSRQIPDFKKNLPAYITVDESLVSGSNLGFLKQMLDRALSRFGIAPVSGSLLQEFEKQLCQGMDSPVHIEMPDYILWGLSRGPLWIIPFNSPTFYAPEIFQDGDVCHVTYNGIRKHYTVKEGQKFTSFQDGMQVPLKKEGQITGRKSLKKVYQELRLPPPVRTNLPVLIDQNDELVKRVSLSFINPGQDLVY